jgi:hypothetical protein
MLLLLLLLLLLCCSSAAARAAVHPRPRCNGCVACWCCSLSRLTHNSVHRVTQPLQGVMCFDSCNLQLLVTLDLCVTCWCC